MSAGVALAQEKTERLDSAIVSLSRAGDKTPVAFTMVDRQALRSTNPIHSLPEALALQPSVVTYNEGGTGLGNSAITVRGSKGSQINVTLNGITLNDQESQEVFWVNIPSLTNLISTVQLQRGLGTTANGAGAFGASINMNTASIGPDPSARVEISRGMWNTFVRTVSASTGLTSKGLYANVAYSRGTTDGYIRNAFVKSRSAFVTLGWLGGRNSLRLTWLMGDQKSGITWDGIDYEKYKTDRRYNGSGEYYDDEGNLRYYDNQTDNYTQNHLQLNYSRQLGDRFTWTSTLNYTRGDGYDEYYKQDRKLVNFGFAVPVTGADGNEYFSSDAIYQKKMGNDYWVFNSDVRYVSDRLRLTAGVNLSSYYGDHWGKFLWVRVLPESYDFSVMNRSRAWYSNDAHKKEADFFARGEFAVADNLTVYADFQFRTVGLRMYGRDDDYIEYGSKEMIDLDKGWNFFNPRIGMNWDFAPGHRAYVSVSMGNREPGRSDIKENIKGDGAPVRPEKMADTELGWSMRGNGFTLSANLYSMEYRDMLLETGRLSTAGYAVKENVPRAWRRGIELCGSWNGAGWLSVGGNLTLSDNRIDDYTSYVSVVDENWDYTGATQAFGWGRTRILLSPSTVGMLQAAVTPWKNSASNSLKTTTLTVSGKYVGRQYIDNTQRDGMEIPSYFVMNASVSHEFKLGRAVLGLSAYVNNILNRDYFAYGWRWEACSEGASKDEIESGIGVYPQAPVNVMFKAWYAF